MKKQIAIFILLILCLPGVDTVNAQLTRKRTEVEEKQLVEKYADRKAVATPTSNLLKPNLF